MSTESKALVLPPFGKTLEIKMEIEPIVVAESRMHEVQMVNPITYVDLEHTFNEAYRVLKRHLSTIGFQITQAQKAMDQARAEVLLGSYADFMQGKPKSHDNADLRNAYFMRDAEYIAALDRLNQLKALESHFDGKIKTLENVCRYMRKQMDLLIRGGLSSADLYNTQGRK